ncbi:unnamed protein product [Pseudo-nitzschia multistriata]|uniref:GYF domain-containing protein n=1 Tax=Pseudo-nitzschia multistriata TaxID=183589 RepID=A0A448ZEW1_9STRA|nr:unnamed protein product [Pseudo-nitzschia multistriata]
MSAPSKRSVKFMESSSDQPPPKWSRPMGSNSNSGSGEAPRNRNPPGVLRPSSHRVHAGNHRGRNQRGNEDELDDIDDWNEQEDGDHGIGDQGLPTQSQLIEVKRRRREQRGERIAAFDGDHPDEAEASLATEGVRIEPFHMREEETDGTGYFDGDTYVFRRNVPAGDGEADAWADTLMRDGDDDGDGPAIGIATSVRDLSSSSSSSAATSAQEDLDGLSKEQLYERIVPLLGDARESIMQAIQRYGRLAKTKNGKKHRRNHHHHQQQQKQPQEAESGNNDNGRATDVAKSHLDDLTGVANALLLKGEVNIYDASRHDIFRRFPSLSTQPGSKPDSGGPAAPLSKNVKWEYQGNEDKQLHVVTTEQMIAWVQSGYFVGAQRVRIRTIAVQGEGNASKPESAEPSLSTQDDMLADLMDDDSEDEEDSRPAKKARETGSTTTVKGEWMWSDEVDYKKYML